MDLMERVTEVVSGLRAEMRDSLCSLIRIPTVNPPGDCYRECAAFLEALLGGWGLDCRLISIPQAAYPRYSILAAYGDGGDGLHFHGHYDVVAAQSPAQFTPSESDGRLYGRGSSDMKGGIVAMLYAVRAIQQCGIPLHKRLTLSLVPDEETGGPLGIRYLAKENLLPGPAVGMLMPEPTSGVVWHACRGALTLRVGLRGRTAHVGLEHEGVNAFEQMAAVVQSLLELKREVRSRITSLPMTPPTARRSVMLIGGESGSGANHNVVPAEAYFSIDRRLNPEETVAAARKELEAVFARHRHDGVRIEVEVMQEGEPSVAPVGSELAQTLSQAVGEVTGSAPAFELCPGILETRFFTARGMPAYAYGPGLLAPSHGPEEHVHLDDLARCTVIYALTAMRLLAG